jgi:hypothetical protein
MPKATSSNTTPDAALLQLAADFDTASEKRVKVRRSRSMLAVSKLRIWSHAFGRWGKCQMTTPDDEDGLLPFLTAKDIEELGLGADRIKQAYGAGELSHLSETEIKTLLDNAWQRDIQKTIMR